MIGKFQGTISPTTPIGSRSVKSRPGTRHRDGRAAQLGRRAGVELEDLRDLADLPARPADRLADLAALQGRELVLVVADDLREAEQQPAPVGRGHRAPLAVERGLRGVDGPVDVLAPAQRRRRDDRAPVRLDDLERPAVRRVDGAPADDHPRDGDGGRPRLVRGHSTIDAGFGLGRRHRRPDDPRVVAERRRDHLGADGELAG